MKTLILMRHSYASSNIANLSDHERPLTDAGQLLAAETGRLLAEYRVDTILCSSAMRTRQTAELVAEAAEIPSTPRSLDGLYLAPADSYLPVVAAEVPAESDVVLAIGHNPGVANLVERLAQEPLPFPPASAAVFCVETDDWNQLASRNTLAVSLQDFIVDGRYVRRSR